MKLAALLNNRYAEIENRKRALKQKNADEAYKKNAQYFQPMSNPALEQLVDLLTGKKEREVNGALSQPREETPSAQMAIDQEQTPVAEKSFAAPSIAQPVVSSTHTDVAQSIEKTVDVVEKPQTQMNVKQAFRNRLFEKATACYQFQAQMARSGFQMDEPIFYQSA